MNASESYAFGFISSDGSMSSGTRNRGKIAIEINQKDEDILHKINQIFNNKGKIRKRERNTNFGTSKTIILSIYDLDIRTRLNSYGLPYGKKDMIIAPPTCEYSKVDYIRGLIDGDGSLGLTTQNLPFISFVTNSEYLKKAWTDYITEITGFICNSNRNIRDNAYNIMITKEKAQDIVKTLYYKDCICLNRKKEKANDVLSWIRPINMKKINFIRHKWTNEDIQYIQNHSLNESINHLNRTQNAIQMKLYHLKI